MMLRGLCTVSKLEKHFIFLLSMQSVGCDKYNSSTLFHCVCVCNGVLDFNLQCISVGYIDNTAIPKCIVLLIF